MIKIWTVEALNDVVKAELKALPEELQADFLRISTVLQEFGPHRTGMPYVRHLEGKLWEMRLHAASGIARAIYVAAFGRRLVVLHAFIKKTRKTQRHHIDLAKKRLRGVLL